jgi:hypothetical protein
MDEWEIPSCASFFRTFVIFGVGEGFVNDWFGGLGFRFWSLGSGGGFLLIGLEISIDGPS